MLAVGDSVWIQLIITVGVVFTAGITLATLIVNIRAGRDRAEAAQDRIEVKKTLAATNEVVGKQLGQIHELVNSGMLEQKKISMIHAKRAADLSKDPVDIEVARLAEVAYEQHRLHQECVDEKAENAKQ